VSAPACPHARDDFPFRLRQDPAADEHFDDRGTSVTIEIPQSLHLTFGQPQPGQFAIFRLDAPQDTGDFNWLEHCGITPARHVLHRFDAMDVNRR